MKVSHCSPSSLDHLLMELRRIELKLHLELLRMRQRNGPPDDDMFRGLYISEKEIDNIADTSSLLQGTNSVPPTNTDSTALTDTLHRLEHDIALRKKEGLQSGCVLRLHELGRSFHLSGFDIDALLVCLLPELNLKYQRLYAYLQDDVTRKSPTVDLVLRLLGGTFADRLAARKAFWPQAPLMEYHLLRLHDDSGPRTGPLLARSLQVDERITGYLLGADDIDALLQPFAHIVNRRRGLGDIILDHESGYRLPQLVARLHHTGVICHLRGPRGGGKQSTAEAICCELGQPMLIVDAGKALATDTSFELATRLIFREGLLQKAALYFKNWDSLLNDEKQIGVGYDSIVAYLERYPHWVFLAGENEWQPAGILIDKPLVHVELPIPSYKQRIQLWSKQGRDEQTLAPDTDFTGLAGKFKLTGGQIRDVMATARTLARWRDPQTGLVTTQDLYRACRKQTRGALGTLAHNIQPRYGWEDIILPEDQMVQLREICGYVEHYHTVYGEWGFDRKLSTGKGLNVLFAGPSGTGKTMAAEIMANELGLELYKIDLSAIVSKYIGETEKNLDRIFREAQTSNAILFFDEADALFGRRSEVRDSHDRYANIEMAYLLQKMDEYEGVVILATNLRKNMDEAFARRMHFAVEFPFPEESDRYRIWRSVFPSEAPLASTVDMHFLARQFRITGGNIKNVALTAAFLAAQDGGCVTMNNLIHATRREYQKIGRLCTEGEFAQYFELVKG
ncbi:MAG: AAA family ATPase [Dehalococcoidia bacterium]